MVVRGIKSYPEQIWDVFSIVRPSFIKCSKVSHLKEIRYLENETIKRLNMPAVRKYRLNMVTLKKMGLKLSCELQYSPRYFNNFFRAIFWENLFNENLG